MFESGWHIAAWACGGVTVALLLTMSHAFWQSPEKGFEMTTHRLEQLPSVMSDR